MSLPHAPRRVVTTHLEMADAAQLRPAGPARTAYTLQRAMRPSPELSRYLYRAVGGDWYWLTRIDWTYDRWLAWLDRPAVQTWVAYVDGTPAGYGELEAQPGGDVEVVYFGLLPAFIGLGLGGALLTDVVQRAWAMEARRVWVHTCDLDHPRALANYQARGFAPYRVETQEQATSRQPSAASGS